MKGRESKWGSWLEALEGRVWLAAWEEMRYEDTTVVEPSDLVSCEPSALKSIHWTQLSPKHTKNHLSSSRIFSSRNF